MTWLNNMSTIQDISMSPVNNIYFSATLPQLPTKTTQNRVKGT